MSIPGYLLPIGLVCAMAACTTKPPERIQETRNYNARFLCDGMAMQVQFTPFNALLESEGASVQLAQQPADGFLYAGEGHSLRARIRDEATWTDAKGAVRNCRDVTSPAGNVTEIKPPPVPR